MKGKSSRPGEPAGGLPALSLARDNSQTLRAVMGIRDLVLGGAFKAGERLAELALVERLGVSRTPIRAALQRLADEGLLEPAPSAGYLVRGFSETDIFDAIEVRGTIEGLAARLAAERGVSDAMLDDMRRCLDRIDAVLTGPRRGGDLLDRYAAENSRFHRLLIAAAASPTVDLALGRVASLPFAASDAFVAAQAQLPESIAVLHTAQGQHRAIVAAIAERSSARAEPLVREHARIARQNLELVMRNADAMRHLVGAPLIKRRDAV